MKYSVRALNMIKGFEKLRLVSYKAVASEKLWTVGYGHYGVKEHVTITKKEAEEYLLKDICKAEKAVNRYNKKYSFNQNQYDALISFAFNVGSIKQLTRYGTRTKDEIGDAIILYIKSGGIILNGLIRRRNLEYHLYNTPINSVEKSASQLAKEVIAGKWGNGEERKINLEACGYDYKLIQKFVNILLN